LPAGKHLAGVTIRPRASHGSFAATAHRCVREGSNGGRAAGEQSRRGGRAGVVPRSRTASTSGNHPCLLLTVKLTAAPESVVGTHWPVRPGRAVLMVTMRDNAATTSPASSRRWSSRTVPPRAPMPADRSNLGTAQVPSDDWRSSAPTCTRRSSPWISAWFSPPESIGPGPRWSPVHSFCAPPARRHQRPLRQVMRRNSRRIR
jgi:hypothetical protein